MTIKEHWFYWKMGVWLEHYNFDYEWGEAAQDWLDFMGAAKDFGVLVEI